MANRPRIRVAVAQLDYHPANDVDDRGPREDPLFSALHEPSSLRPPGVPLQGEQESMLRRLEQRIAAVHDRHLALKIEAIIRHCRRWGVDLLVLPEYSVPPATLSTIARLTGDLLVVAGTHRCAQDPGPYSALGWRGEHADLRGREVAPVLHRGRLIQLQVELTGAPGDERSAPPKLDRGGPIALRGAPDTWLLGLLFGRDLASLGGGDPRPSIAAELGRCDLLALLGSSAENRRALGALTTENRRALGALTTASLNAQPPPPTLLAMSAAVGGSRTSGPASTEEEPLLGEPEEGLRRGEESLLIHDLDPVDGEPPRLVALPSLVYRSHPITDEYAEWCARFEVQLAEATRDDIDALLTACVEAKSLLMGAGALAQGQSRDRRLRTLLDAEAPIAELDHIRALTWEVVLPAEALPMEPLRGAMGQSALRTLRSWVRAEPRRDVERAKRWLACAEHLEARLARADFGALDVPTPGMWSQAGLDAFATVAAELTALSVRAPKELRRRSDGAVEGAPRADEPRGELAKAAQAADDKRTRAVGDDAPEPEPSERVATSDEEFHDDDDAAIDPLLGGEPDDDDDDDELPELRVAHAQRATDDASATRAGAEPRAPLSEAAVEDFERRLDHLAELWPRLRSASLHDTDERFEPPSALTEDGRTLRPALALLEESVVAPAKICLLLGPAGSGKSTLLLEWADRRWRSGARPLPLVVRLGRGASERSPIERLLEVAAVDAHLDDAGALLQALIDRRRLLPCFDGLDAVPPSERAQLLAQLVTLTEGGGQLLIASRQPIFAEGSAAQIAVDATTTATRVLLQPFSSAQVASLVAQIASSERERSAILGRLASVYDLDLLTERPLLLGMVLQALERLDPATRVNAADLYEAYLSAWQAKADALPDVTLGAEARATLLEAIALALWDGRATQCTIDGLRLGFLRDLSPDLAGLDDAALAASIRTSLPGGFVEGDPAEGLRFTHRSHVDFFVARALTRHLRRCHERLLAIRPLSPAITNFVLLLLRRRGGDSLTQEWTQTLDGWVSYMPGAPSPWRRNARRVLDGLRRTEMGGRAAQQSDLDDPVVEQPEAEEATPAEATPAEDGLEAAVEAEKTDVIDAEEVEAIDEAEKTDEVETEAEAEAEEADPEVEEAALEERRREANAARAPLGEALAPRSFDLAELPSEGSLPETNSDRFSAIPDAATEASAPEPLSSAPSEDAPSSPPGPRAQPQEPTANRQRQSPSAPPPGSVPLPSPPQERSAGRRDDAEGEALPWATRRPSSKKEHLLAKARLLSKRAAPQLAPNRFLPGRPLADPNLPGRENILRELSTLLSLPSPALLKGPRRSGKTSIFHALEGRERGRRRVLRTSLERGGRLREPDDLARLLAPDLRDHAAPAEALWRRLEEERDRGPPPAFLLDELAWLREGSDELFAWLRALGQEGLAAVVLAGSHSDWVELIKRANRTPGSSFGNDYTVIELGPLRDEEAIRFLVVTAPDDVELHPDRTARWIVEYCGCWPFYLQVMGYAVVEEVRSGRHGSLVRKQDLHDLYQRRLLLERGDAVFRSRWGDLRAPAQELLQAELERARAAGRLQLTAYRDLPRRARTLLSDADLIDAVAGWKIDRPFTDWLYRNLDELELSNG